MKAQVEGHQEDVAAHKAGESDVGVNAKVTSFSKPSGASVVQSETPIVAQKPTHNQSSRATGAHEQTETSQERSHLTAGALSDDEKRHAETHTTNHEDEEYLEFLHWKKNRIEMLGRNSDSKFTRDMINSGLYREDITNDSSAAHKLPRPPSPYISNEVESNTGNGSNQQNLPVHSLVGWKPPSSSRSPMHRAIDPVSPYPARRVRNSTHNPNPDQTHAGPLPFSGPEIAAQPEKPQYNDKHSTARSLTQPAPPYDSTFQIENNKPHPRPIDTAHQASYEVAPYQSQPDYYPAHRPIYHYPPYRAHQRPYPIPQPLLADYAEEDPGRIDLDDILPNRRYRSGTSFTRERPHKSQNAVPFPRELSGFGHRTAPAGQVSRSNPVQSAQVAEDVKFETHIMEELRLAGASFREAQKLLRTHQQKEDKCLNPPGLMNARQQIVQTSRFSNGHSSRDLQASQLPALDRPSFLHEESEYANYEEPVTGTGSRYHESLERTVTSREKNESLQRPEFPSLALEGNLVTGERRGKAPAPPDTRRSLDSSYAPPFQPPYSGPVPHSPQVIRRGALSYQPVQYQTVSASGPYPQYGAEADTAEPYTYPTVPHHSHQMVSYDDPYRPPYPQQYTPAPHNNPDSYTNPAPYGDSRPPWYPPPNPVPSTYTAPGQFRNTYDTGPAYGNPYYPPLPPRSPPRHMVHPPQSRYYY